MSQAHRRRRRFGPVSLLACLLAFQLAWRLGVPATAVAAPRQDEAAPATGNSAAPPTPRWEWVGLELTPVAYALGQVRGRFEDGYSRAAAGPGGTLRLLRRQSSVAYFTPLQFGLFIGNEGKTVFLHAEVEAGVIVPVAQGHRLELGLGVGLAAVFVAYAGGCDGYCTIGGLGPFVSPVARYRVEVLPNLFVGLAIRAAVPVGESDSVDPVITARGTLILAGLDIGRS